jgi:hypothetical protein
VIQVAPEPPGVVVESTSPATEKHNTATSQSTTLIPALSADVDDFEADIRAILAQGGAAEPPPPQTNMRDQPSTEAALGEDGHAIFDQMGHNMRYANTFNLGAIELGQRFDAFERELDREGAIVEPVGAVMELRLPDELDDIDVLADIVQIGEAASAEMEQAGADTTTPAPKEETDLLVATVPSPSEQADRSAAHGPEPADEQTAPSTTVEPPQSTEPSNSVADRGEGHEETLTNAHDASPGKRE